MDVRKEGRNDGCPPVVHLLHPSYVCILPLTPHADRSQFPPKPPRPGNPPQNPPQQALYMCTPLRPLAPNLVTHSLPRSKPQHRGQRSPPVDLERPSRFEFSPLVLDIADDNDLPLHSTPNCSPPLRPKCVLCLPAFVSPLLQLLTTDASILSFHP
ncbi:hypothetical protein FA13DRAFT_1791273 [Coprinellus micaceus]|uniref:Uncharacterized protein n=1 Tax=Coprinellus micaceus TaxID=71717 RepID=A0A4Y7TDG8_COPMI|nr:hypothetical protein FA13DRAFT_1791273 [Coprinellus micaceus]